MEHATKKTLLLALSRLQLALACILVTRIFAAESVDGPVYEYGFTGYLQQQSMSYQPFGRWPGLRTKVLSEDQASERLAVYAEFPAQWRSAALAAAEQSIDIVVLDGQLEFGENTLQKFDFAFVPPGVRPPAMRTNALVHALLFFDPPAPDQAAVARQRERGAYVTHFDESRWQPASLAKRAGVAADLRIFHLKKDPFTAARTWYVKLDSGMQVPWEVHTMAEEGYVMRGGYRLAECLPQRTVIGDYSAGGYFWRPGGIAHSGPDSGPKGSVIWLQRTQVALDVVFYRQCREGRTLEPLTR